MAALFGPEPPDKPRMRRRPGGNGTARSANPRRRNALADSRTDRARKARRLQLIAAGTALFTPGRPR
jgi:hypothetical protein